MAQLTSHLKKLGSFSMRHISLVVFIALLDGLGWLLYSGNYTAFLHPRFWPFLAAGMVIIVGFIIALVFGEKLPSLISRKEALIKSIVMITPLVFMYTVAGRGMGAHALTQKYIGGDQGAVLLRSDSTDQKAMNARSDYKLSLLDIAKNMKRLKGNRVITEGLVYIDPNVPKNHLMLFRFAVFCCAADAIPVWILVKKEEMASFENESWIEVEGILEIAKMQGQDVPVVQADMIKKKALPSPGERYLFLVGN